MMVVLAESGYEASPDTPSAKSIEFIRQFPVQMLMATGEHGGQGQADFELSSTPSSTQASNVEPALRKI